MTLSELLKIIEGVAKANELSTPFICGGTPRDKILHNVTFIPDVDITTGNKDIIILGKKVAEVLGDICKYIELPENHAIIMIKKFKIDLSTNYINPAIVNKNTSNLLKETYSRDFTCNSLLMSMDLKTIFDPTKRGIKDIKDKMIRTCLPVEISLGLEPILHKRIVRIIYLAAKLGFDVDPKIIHWVKNNPEKIANCNKQYLSGKLAQAFEFDKDRTLSLLDEMAIWKYVPASPELRPYMTSYGRI